MQQMRILLHEYFRSWKNLALGARRSRMYSFFGAVDRESGIPLSRSNSIVQAMFVNADVVVFPELVASLMEKTCDLETQFVM